MVNFTKHANLYLSFILSTLIIALFIIFSQRIHLGIDFTGGGVLTLSKEASQSEAEIIKKNKNIASVKDESVIINIQDFEDFKVKSAQIADTIKLETGISVVKQDFIGAKFGKSALLNSIFGICLSLFAIFIYMSIKFNISLAFSATIALIYNCIISLALASLAKISIGVMIICAFLTLIGYCINDTVVVFDRIRQAILENQKLSQKEVINQALNKVLSRSIKTSVVTFIAVLPLFLFAINEISDFSAIILCGIAFGTFSSIAITPIYTKFFTIKINPPKPKKILEDPMKYV